MKLSKTQQSIVDLLNDGWELGRSLTMDGRSWIQKGGVGRGGESRDVRGNTVVSLVQKGVIVCVERKFPTSRYHLNPNP